MNYIKLVGQNVYNKKYGEGSISHFIEADDGAVRFIVSFKEGDKTFQYPQAFIDGFLQASVEIQPVIDADIQTYSATKQAEKDREDAERLARINAEHQTERAGQRRHNAPRIQRANIAFKCNYCDGGKTADRLGFVGACSSANMQYNINVRKHSQCKDNSKCAAYLRGECTYDEVIAACPVCYESAMLEHWTAAAGMDLRGENAGRGRRIENVQLGSLAVLTTRLPESEEKDRIIFAVFLVDERDDGDGGEAGYVKANSQWRIELKPNEAQRMLFWNYYANQDGSVNWSQGLYRYLTDEQAERILRDIVVLKTNEQEKAFAQAFLDEFFHNR